jgi:S-adenosylmethionine:tRNA ribosyltransferase-isomerase
MHTNFDFDLPPELIAQTPPRRRGDARLLLVECGQGVRGERVFRDLPLILRPGDRLVLNDSRVIPARVMTRREDTGGQVEILLVRPAAAGDPAGSWSCLARPARRLRPGVQLRPTQPVPGAGAEPPLLTVLAKRDAATDGRIVVGSSEDLAQVAARYGVMPLPPYVRRSVADTEQAAEDRERYQTVYANSDASGAGSVAAPTAGLHFSDATLAQLHRVGIQTSFVRLHVGPGTFQPPSAAQIASGRLHREAFCLPAAVSRELSATRAAGGRIIAVGTTALRVLETVRRLGLEADGPEQRVFGGAAATPDPFFTGEARRKDGYWGVSGQTRLFIRPPESVTAADGLLTNFHLPGSSLLMLVASLLGGEIWRDVYRQAVQTRMRFYSYGDCMLILPAGGTGRPQQDRSAT